jgi:hypothetical protein
LRDELLEWLKQVVMPESDKRGLVLMSHHQYYSGFEQRYRKPARQMWDAGIKRSVLWFWGHEHRLAGYDLYGPDRLQAYGRCVGHGGMPVERGNPKRKRLPQPAFYDNRLSGNGFGINGHVNLSFAGPRLTADYVDLDGKVAFSEDWTVQPTGDVQLLSRRKLATDPDFHA